MARHIEQWKRLMHIYGEIDAAYHDAALKMGLSDSAITTV